ncbi:peptidase domain-containing ABC transporter [Prevotella sp. 10(H)]|uniref:peptidase domain-containing ABC transporter n=1 Tax=Prevotella sp. 10(H) TaxID=1158294 RepID=UPI0004A76F53|nr:peptidase domain-containing ABC transporter [Prevotella sp. 10(H)]
MKKNTKIKQHDITDCGAACLASISAHYGLFFPIARIRQYASTDRKGTNALGLAEAAEKLNFSAKGVKASITAVKQKLIPLPAIAHLHIKDKGWYHYVVIYKITDKTITVMDPADGEFHALSYEKFEESWTGVIIILEPKAQFVGGNVDQSLSRKFLSLLLPHKSVMTQAVFGSVIYSILGLSMAIYVGKITDYVLVDQNLNLLHLMGVIMVVILILRTFIDIMKSVLALKTGQKIDAALILGYYKHLIRLPQNFFDTMRVGEIISRVNDAVKIRYFINNVALDLVVNVLILFFTLFIMLFYSWKMTLVTLISVPLFSIIYYFFNKLNKKFHRRIMENMADLESQLVESLNSINTIKRFGVEEFANAKTESRFVRLLKSTYTSVNGSIVADSSIEFVSTGTTILILWIGSTYVIDQEITAGLLMTFYALIGYVLSPISSLISANEDIQGAVIAADRLFQIMDLEREADNTHKVQIVPEMIGDIKFENVHFRYGTRKDLFEDLNFIIHKGRTTAIVGKSGSGKTTIASLMQKIYPIAGGYIKIGDMNIEQVSDHSLRRIVGTVPQKVELFAGNIIENIALGELEPDMNKIIQLCSDLALEKLIDGLPQKYETQIGEQGASLSGGERQRMAIARALYKDPEILIMDEATSSLDSFSEKYVKQVLERLAKEGKTIILIAHRLTTTKDADHIIVLEEGKVRETGNHTKLMDTKGSLYRKLWEEQFSIL